MPEQFAPLNMYTFSTTKSSHTNLPCHSEWSPVILSGAKNDMAKPLFHGLL